MDGIMNKNLIIFILSVLCLINGHYNISVGNTELKSSLIGNKLDSNQYFIEREYPIYIEGKGQLTFGAVVGKKDDKRKYQFFLLDRQKKVTYTFPTFYGSVNWNGGDGIQDVVIKDLNHDGLNDIIVIAYHNTGAGGPDGVEPFPVAGLYFQNTDQTFSTNYELDEAINEAGYNKTVEDIIRYMENYPLQAEDTVN
ncbi:hypothetical protein MKX74_19055 [Paenibacillus sp. FSL K6-1230]